MSEPAPREMICFWMEGDCDRKRETRLSIVVVRTYVPFPPEPGLRVRCYSRGTNRVHDCVRICRCGSCNGETKGEGSIYTPRLMIGNRRRAGEGAKKWAKGSRR